MLWREHIVLKFWAVLVPMFRSSVPEQQAFNRASCPPPPVCTMHQRCVHALFKSSVHAPPVCSKHWRSAGSVQSAGAVGNLCGTILP
eukprot:scaffold30750_cov19-Tisochrysis_lutea.AAC.1